MIYRNYSYIAFALVLFTSCSLAFAESKTVQNTVTDDLKNRVAVLDSSLSPRIASISIFGAELALALGIEPVSMSDYPGGLPDYIPPLENTSRLGPRSQTNFEALYHSHPNIVIGLGRMIEPYSRRYKEISPVAGFDLITMEDSLEAVQKSAALVNMNARGQQINKCFIDSLQKMKERVGDNSVTGVFLTSAGITPRAYYSHFMTVGLMEALNVKNAVGQSPYSSKTPFSGQIGLEWLVKLNPDIIFMYESSSPKYTETKLWNSLTAVINKRVYRVDMNWREPEGPYSRIWVAMDIAHKAYPELFDVPTKNKLNQAISC